MILCICNRGNVRSVTLANMLKDLYGFQDVWAVGTQTLSMQCAQYLHNYVGFMVAVGDIDENSVFEALRGSYYCYRIDIGPDRWMMPGHPDLVDTLLKYTPALVDAIGLPVNMVNYASPLHYQEAHRYAFERVANEVLGT